MTLFGPIFTKLAAILLIGHLGAVIRSVQGSSISDETDRIFQNILTNYNGQTHPPTTREDGSLEVAMTSVPLFITIDEDKSVFKWHFWLVMTWTDVRLKWDSLAYSNVSRIHVDPKIVWKPDIRMFNTIVHNEIEETDLILYSSGNLYWSPPVTSHVSCNLDYTYWPWDLQRCDTVFGSWTRSGLAIDIVNLNRRNTSSIPLTNFVANVWEVVSATSVKSVTYYDSSTEPWPDVTVTFIVRRVSFVDQKLAVLPLVVVSCLCLATFWIMPLNRNRLILSATMLILVLADLCYLRSLLPSAGAKIPLVVSLAGSLAVMITIQLLLTVVLANLLVRSDSPAWWLETPFDGIMGKILCLSSTPVIQIPGVAGYSIDLESLRKRANPSSSTLPKSEEDKVQVTAGATPVADVMPVCDKEPLSGWALVTLAVDRIFFILYFIFIVGFLLAYIGGATTQ